MGEISDENKNADSSKVDNPALPTEPTDPFGSITSEEKNKENGNELATSEPDTPLTPTVWEFTSNDGTPKYDTPAHPWPPRQTQWPHQDLSSEKDGAPADADVEIPPTQVSPDTPYEDEDIDLTRKKLETEFDVAADLSCAAAAKSGHNPLPEMVEALNKKDAPPISPSVRELCKLPDRVVTREDQNKARKRELEGSEESEEESTPRKKPAGRAKAKAKSKAKSKAKAKAKSQVRGRSNKAKPSGSPSPKGKVPSPKAKAKAKAKGKAKAAASKPDPKSDKKAKAKAKAKGGTKGSDKCETGKATFARRNKPKREKERLWWTAVRDAFQECIQGKVDYPSSLEDWFSKQFDLLSSFNVLNQALLYMFPFKFGSF